ncbi:MAG: hypothetical protein JJT85_12170 [Chromatiales bacterium]|nr:hypothetical protein [Chromatiales bacterium]
MNHQGATLALALTALANAGALHAQELGYTYIELGYLYLEVDQRGSIRGDPDGDGWIVSGSWALDDRFHLVASYSDAELEAPGFRLDYRLTNAGVGMRHELSPAIDLVGRVAYVRADVKRDMGNFNENGFGLSAGLRGLATPELELNAMLSYVDLGGRIGSSGSLDLGAVFSLSDRLALFAEGSLGNEGSGVSGGVRLYFGR